jgi:signal transduction histidine kinase
MSVRAQLNALVAATITLVLLAFLVPLGLLLRRSAEDRADAAATLRAQSAATLLAYGQAPPDQVMAGQPVVTVFYANGTIAGPPALRTPSIELASRGRSFSAASGDGVEVLIAVQGLDSTGGTAVVRAYVSDSVRHAGVTRTWTVLGALGAVLLIIGVLLADRLGRRLTHSVTELAATADRLAGGDLTARVRPSSSPELRRVGTELNRLAGRIQGLLTAAREDVADLAHRLRTPVTALRLDAESVRDADDRARLCADVDSLNRLVDEVIRTARRPVREGAGTVTDLVEVVAERVAFWTALAEDTGRPVEARLSAEPLWVLSPRDDLIAAVDALLGNVFSHTPDHVAVRVEAWPRRGGGARLTVEDAGPGFGSAAQAAVTRGVSAGGSTGLGLDIARRTAEAAGGMMRLGTGVLGGALVDLIFADPEATGPMAAPAAPEVGPQRTPEVSPQRTPDAGPQRPEKPLTVQELRAAAAAQAMPAVDPSTMRPLPVRSPQPEPSSTWDSPPAPNGNGAGRPRRTVPTPVPRATRRMR